MVRITGDLILVALQDCCFLCAPVTAEQFKGLLAALRQIALDLQR